MDKLTEKQKEAFRECAFKIQHWRKFKSDYEALEQRLSTLADKLSHDIMVPFGPKAFMPGTMVHTNNITVLLGENWFTEMSAKQAVEFIKRRKIQCEQMLEDLEKEQKKYQDWLEMTKTISEEQPLEIVESCNDEELAQWREQHRKNVIAHKRKEAEERAMHKGVNHVESLSTNDTLSDDGYYEKLDELMMTEESSKQMNNSNSESEDDLSEESEDDDTESKSMNIDSVEEKNGVHQHSDELNGFAFVESDRNERHDKHVRWIDISEANSKCINFTHSKLPAIQHYNRKKNKRRRRNSSTSDFDEEEPPEKNGSGSPLINSPSDIYKCFSFARQQSKPKSILKSNSLDGRDFSDTGKTLKLEDIDNEQSTMDYETTDKYINNFLANEVNRNLAFTGEVTEHSKDSPQATAVPFQRPKSLFRSSRQSVTKH